MTEHSLPPGFPGPCPGVRNLDDATRDERGDESSPLSVGQHYESIAARYDDHWDRGHDHVQWLAERIVNALQLRHGDRVADVGCGTGLFARGVARLVRPEHGVLCVDPSAAMLRQLGTPVPAGLVPLRASAEEIADRSMPLPPSHTPLDAIWLKEVVHHLTDPAATLAGLTRLLTPGGRLPVVMLPATISYPLFPAALRRFEQLQPDPRRIARYCTDAGLTVALTHIDRTLHIDRDRYIRMVRGRYMSVLSTFSDTELDNGVEWMRDILTAGELTFPDRLAMITGHTGTRNPVNTNPANSS